MINFIQSIFSPIIGLLGFVLEFFHGHGIPWWLSIVFLTAIIRSLLFPLTVKQVQSMRAMQELKPEMDKIREKYQDNRQKQQEEQAKLFKERNINPLGGCLPILAQLPIFISMFYVIRRFGGTQNMFFIPNVEGSKPGFAEGGALWFANLSTFDPLYVLPVLSAVAMIAAMEFTSSQVQPQQRWLMRLLPIAFTFVVARFPAGLQLYIVTTNLMTLGQNYLIYNVGPKLKRGEEKSGSAAGEGDVEESTGRRVRSQEGPSRTERNRQRRKRQKKKKK
jgi:YidC/Oxa1 family membrane protein insertase